MYLCRESSKDYLGICNYTELEMQINLGIWTYAEIEVWTNLGICTYTERKVQSNLGICTRALEILKSESVQPMTMTSSMSPFQKKKNVYITCHEN